MSAFGAKPMISLPPWRNRAPGHGPWGKIGRIAPPRETWWPRTPPIHSAIAEVSAMDASSCSASGIRFERPVLPELLRKLASSASGTESAPPSP